MRKPLRTLLVVTLATLSLLSLVLAVRAFTAEPFEPTVGPIRPLDVDEDEAVRRLAEAIRIETISRPPPAQPSDSVAIFDFHRFLEGEFPRVYETLEVETISGLSLLFTWSGSDPELAPILLSAHFDVVPAPDEDQSAWTHPPFAGVTDDTYVWGRGTLDNKGPLMAILEATEALLEEEFEPRRTVLLAFGHDEELGGLVGARETAARLEDRGLHPLWSLDEGLAIVEGVIPGLGGAAGLVGTQEKGYMTLRLVSRGEGGHSSAPAATTAVQSLAEAVERVDALEFPARLAGPTRELLETLSPHLDPLLRVATENLWLFGRPAAWFMSGRPDLAGLVRTTGAVTVLEAGGVENLVPATAEAVANFRIAPWNTPEQVRGELLAAVEDLNLDVLPRAGPRPIPASRRSSSDSEGFDRIRTTIHRVFPDVTVVAPALVPAATDARHYEAVAENVYRFAPFRADTSTFARIHGVDERISISDYVDMIRFYGELIRSGAD